MVQPLDLESIFVNTLAGSIEIFFFLALIFFAYLAARFRMPNQVFLLLMGVFILFMASLGFKMFYPLLIVVMGLVIYFGYAKLFK